MTAKSQRKWLVVDPRFQFRLVLRMAGYLVVYSLVAFHLFFLFYAFGVATQKGVAVAYQEFLSYQKPFLTTLLLITPMVAYDLLKFSNRIVGPLYRCRRVMRDMAAGQAVAEFKARDQDFLDEFFTDFNALIKVWNAKVAVPPGGQRGGPAPEANGHESIPAATASS